MIDRHVANGEILGVSLLMEDVLLSGEQDSALYSDEDAESNIDERSSVGQGSRPSSSLGNLSSEKALIKSSSSLVSKLTALLLLLLLLLFLYSTGSYLDLGILGDQALFS
jgi:hypothetical protein